MPRFQYQAIDRQQQAVEGHIEDVDVKSAATALEQQGLTLISIRQVGIAVTPESTSPFADGYESPLSASTVPGPPDAVETGSERQSVQRQMQDVLQRGKRLAPALIAYSRELPPGKQRRTLRRLARQLTGGDTSSRDVQLDESLIPLLSASASTGDPTPILRGIVDESQRSGEARRRITSALAYPVFLLFVILAVASFFSWLITPVYQEIFTNFGIELPAVTRAILGFHQRVRETYGLQLLIPAAVLIGAFVYFSVGPVGPFRARLLHVLPVVGSLNRLASQSKFCRYLADFVQAEVAVADALRISGRNTGHFLLRNEANSLAGQLELGAASLTALPLRIVPNTAVHICQSTTKPGAGARILRELAVMYDQQMENRLSLVVNIVEPVFVLVLGIAVGVHFIALMMPLISLVQNLT